MAILRDEDSRIGCLALPISAVAGFMLFALVAAAIGVSAGASSITGLVGAGVGVGVSWITVHR